MLRGIEAIYYYILFSFARNSNLEDLLKGMRMFNALIGDDDDSNGLLRAARGLSDAFGNFLGALDPTTGRVS